MTNSFDMESKKPKFEQKEQPPFSADLRVDFIRHGKPIYTKEERLSGQYEGQLTPESVEKFKQEIEKLADSIGAEELVVIWASPRDRAQQSSKIIEEVLGGKGINVVKIGTKDSLCDVKTTPDFVKEISEKDSMQDWMKYWTTTGELPGGVETPEDVKKRTERLITYLERISRTIILPKNKKLHFICVGHEETVRDLLEEGFGQGTNKGTGPDYGEALRIDVIKSTPEQDAELDLKYRDSESELRFKKDTRKFYYRSD